MVKQTAEVRRIPRGSLSGDAHVVNAFIASSLSIRLACSVGIGHQDACTQPSVYMVWFLVLCLNAENAPQQREHLKIAAQIRTELDLDQSEAPLSLRCRLKSLQL